MENISFDEEKNFVPNDRRFDEPNSSKSPHKVTPLMDIMNVKGCSCDVFMTSEKISWVPLSGEKTKPLVIVKRSKSFIGSNSSGEEYSTEANCIHMCHVLGANIRRLQKAGQPEDQGTCLGFGVYTFSAKNGRTKYWEEVILFDHPSEKTCKKWCQFIQGYVASCEGRPRSVKVFLQPFAGRKFSRFIYATKVQPLFLAAGISQNMTEVTHDGSNIAEVVSETNWEQYDSVICVGGDGTVSRVITAILNRVQSDEGVDVTEPGFHPKSFPIPVGIIPTGSINETAFSIMGTDDVFTAAVHIMLGHNVSVDVCSVANSNRLICWSFNSHLGFFGSLLSRAKKYAVLGEKRFEMAVVRMLSKHKYRPFSCSIQYLPVDDSESNNQTREVACRQGCLHCMSYKDSSSNQTSFNYGEVEDFKDSDSSSCDSIKGLDSCKKFQSVNGNFLSVSVLTIPGVSDLAPCGHSPFTHLQDGCLDLVTVEDVDRKQFVRYLRRFSNNKNQLDLPFVKSYRCKEVRIVPIMSKSWNDVGDDVGIRSAGPPDGIVNDALDVAANGNPHSSAEMVADVDKEFSDSEKDSDDEESVELKNNEWTKKGSQDIKVRSRFFQSADRIRHALFSIKSDFLGMESNQPSSSSPSSSSSPGGSKGEKKEKPLIWSLGMELYEELGLHFSVHEGLVKMHGLGIAQGYHPTQLKWPCLAIF